MEKLESGLKSTEKRSFNRAVFIPTPDPQVLPVNFVLCDCPPVEKLNEYAEYFARNNVVSIVRICESSWYDASQLLSHLCQSYLDNARKNNRSIDNYQIDLRLNEQQPRITCVKIIAGDKGADEFEFKLCDNVHFEDGGVPSADMICCWLDFIEQIASDVSQNPNGRTNRFLSQLGSVVSAPNSKLPSIAVHCVSGLGRAPILIAISLMEYFPSWDALDLVQWLRGYRKGAFNSNQLHWLETEYAKKYRRKWWKKRRRAFYHPKGTGSEVEEDPNELSGSSQIYSKKEGKRRVCNIL